MAAVLPASGTQTPSGSSYDNIPAGQPTGRRDTFPAVVPHTSPLSHGSGSSNYHSASPFDLGTFPARGISPVFEDPSGGRRASPRESMSNKPETTICIYGLPRGITEREVRSIFICAKDFVGLELAPESPSDDGRVSPPKKAAIARFRSFQAAIEAKEHINSKRAEIFEGEVLQAVLNVQHPPNFIPRRNTADSINLNGRAPILSNAPASSNIAVASAGAHDNGVKLRFSQPFGLDQPSQNGLNNSVLGPVGSGLLGNSNGGLSGLSSGLGLPTNVPTPGEYSLAQGSDYLHDAFAGQSPRGNSTNSQASGKALLMESEGENNDEYDSLLTDPTRYLYSTSTTLNSDPAPSPLGLPSLGNGPKPRRSTNPQSVSSRFTNLSLNTNNLPPLQMPTMTSPATAISHSLSNPLTSPISLPMSATQPSHGFMGGYPRILPAANPADQNPPCNTLYVGNLPMNTSEDELKALFSRQRGYKRLCFRTKANGPMCFVEFEDVAYATRALTELYGRGLSNSVKGGIRLSFSKNPLGVRSGNSVGNASASAAPGPSSSSANFQTAIHAPPGLSHPASSVPSGSRQAALEPPSSTNSPFAVTAPGGPIYSNGASAQLRDNGLTSPPSFQTSQAPSGTFSPGPLSPSSFGPSMQSQISIPGYLVGK